VPIFGVLECCLAIAYVALWRAAPDYRVFRTLGIFFALVGTEQFWQYLGGDKSVWALRSFSVAVLIETAAQAMQVPGRRSGRLLTTGKRITLPVSHTVERSGSSS